MLGLGCAIIAGTRMPVGIDTGNLSEPSRPPQTVASETGRLVVGEYLTGIMCAACQAHEAAFDSLLHRYPATQFIGLAYHQLDNFPIADPADSLWYRMRQWYGFGKNSAKASPFPQRYGDDWIDGRPTTTMDNLFEVASQSNDVRAAKYYHDMSRAIDAELQKAPEAVLQVTARSVEGAVVTEVHVESLATDHMDVYVRLCVVEDTIQLRQAPGTPGKPRLDHYMVVRAAARDMTHPMGLPLHGPGTVTYTFDLAKTQQRLLRYWQLGNDPIPQKTDDDVLDRIKEVKEVFLRFPDQQNWRINPARLHVVAFVQDARTGDVLQAAMSPVPAGLVLR
jgi:hypothetical protein